MSMLRSRVHDWINEATIIGSLFPGGCANFQNAFVEQLMSLAPARSLGALLPPPEAGNYKFNIVFIEFMFQ